MPTANARLGGIPVRAELRRNRSAGRLTFAAGTIVAAFGLSVSVCAAQDGTQTTTPTPRPQDNSSNNQSVATSPQISDSDWAKALTNFAGTKGVSRPSQDAIMGFSLPTSVNATTVKAILTRSGDVKKGDVIVKGDDAEEQVVMKLQLERIAKPLNIDRAKAAMDLSEVEYTRVREAFARGGSGTQEVDRARLQAEVSRIDWELAVSNDKQEKLQLDRLQERIKGYSIVAPFDGTIDLVNADVGQVVAGNEKVVRVVDVDPLWVDIPEPTDHPHTWSLTAGAKAWAMANVAGEPRVVECKVIEVAPTSDPASRTRRIRVEVPNPPATNGKIRLLAGEAMWVRFSQPDVAELPAGARVIKTESPIAMNEPAKQVAEGQAK
ncbi:MAG: HlyD family efflux transporter periplasmic adaptor subunit [Phycisphaerales bacterium]